MKQNNPFSPRENRNRLRETMRAMVWSWLALLLLLPAAMQAQVSPTVPKKRTDHNKQIIGYITQWGPWKDIPGLIPKGSLNHLNVDYSQYTIINFSFFGVAVDGSIHSGDYRNPNIAQPGATQQPAPLVNTDIYSSWDLYLLQGELDIIQYISDGSYAYSLGYRNAPGGWSNVNTGESGAFPLAIHKQGGKLGLLDLAHQQGVKVMASIGGWSMSKHFGEMAATPAKRAAFIRDCKKLIAMGFDGIDLDWEYPGQAGMNFTGQPQDYTNFAVLVEEIRAAIGPGKLITAAFTAVPTKFNQFDWARLSRSMDYFNFMTYDYNGGWSGKAGHNSPLYDYPNAEYAGFSLDATTQGIKAAGIPLNKVNLGVAFYGRGVVTNGPAALHAPTVKRQETVSPDGSVMTAADFANWPKDVWDGTPNYQAILAQTANWTEHWDDNAKVPYKTNGSYFLSYDNERSVGLKAQYVKDQQLAGVIVWTLSGDWTGLASNPQVLGGKLVYSPNTKAPLVNKLNEVFATGGTSTNTPPTVSISSPANNATFAAGTGIDINVSAADANGTVAKVEFFQGTTKLGEDMSSPFSFRWTGAAAGTYSLTAKATDNQGATTTSAAVAVTVTAAPVAQAIPGTIQAESFSAQQGTDTEPTTDAGGGRNVNWVETGDWLDYNVNVAAAGTYTVGFRVASIPGAATLQLRNSAGTVLGSVNVGATGGWQSWTTVSTTVTLPAGVQTLRVHVLASTGCNINWLSFAPVTAGNTPPTVSLTGPANGASFVAPASFTLTADAADANGSISKVEFFQGSTKLGEDTSAPFTYAWSGVAAGTYSLTAKATDNQGATTTSAAVSVTVTSGNPSGNPAGKVIVGYFHNWNNASAPYIRLRDVNPKYNVVNIAFAVPVAPGNMTMTFEPTNQPKAEFIADIRTLQAQGRKVQISIGGADAPVELNTTADKDKFVASMKGIITEYGFDGFDIDLEGTSVILNAGDSDFKNSTTPKINNLVVASRELTAFFRGQGKEFWLTAAPEVQYVQGGYANYGTAFGGYLPVLYGLRDLLTFVHVQYYNTGSQNALDEKVYSQGTADFIVAMTDMLLRGFPVARNTANVFPALRQDQVAFGLPATGTGSAPAGGYVPPAEVTKALNYLVNGVSFGGQYVLPARYPNLRGIMTWSINWDRTQGDAFVNNAYAFFGGTNPNPDPNPNPNPTNTPPTVSLTAPAAGATAAAPASFTLTATAADANGTVAKVEFFQGTTKLGEDTDGSNGWSYAWTSVAAGSYSLTARATDNQGATTTSAAVTVTVTGGGSACTVPAWSATAVYVKDNQVSRNGNVYIAKWWTQGEDPLTKSCTDCVWRLVGPCGTARTAAAAAPELTLFPNPVANELTIQAGQSLNGGQFEILDARGRVWAKGAAVGRLNVSKLPAGVYTLKLTLRGHAPVTKRFVK
ncbi:glycosyl hydrolase family 18 protein [Hymenobacter weizhouensis]|uniref:glycosyl hydrolase family 18 protein n=1 Tax=Hymenobacter sp. YIM 151500-1 TaxID=2987689 RepID=UPI00222770E7|nr:glycosyl hydrolase family 18 protein [Hymenobacter sp. YIM 151500-1]UYZ63110.1 glycosyl hydrolase family 18 protein [Hymenobacter sp. YIM 151500-1]